MNKRTNQHFKIAIIFMTFLMLSMLSLSVLAHPLPDDNPIVRAKGGSELDCLSMALYHEARGESYEGILAVKKVILNRVADSRWPDTICGVVLQRKQFSFTNGSIPPITDDMSWEGAMRVAASDNRGTFYNATHYFNPHVVKPKWAKNLRYIATIGNHAFYK